MSMQLRDPESEIKEEEEKQHSVMSRSPRKKKCFRKEGVVPNAVERSCEM